jgi:hypothetical protein
MMNTFLKHLVFASLLVLSTAGAFAAEKGSPTVVQGVAIYLGVVPAEMILGYPKGQAEMHMHGGVPHGSNKYHVVIALFDDATGKRITGAQVKATVAQVGMSGQMKLLEPMQIANTESYGNWFTLPEPGTYRIRLEISGIKDRGKIETEIEYMRP